MKKTTRKSIAFVLFCSLLLSSLAMPAMACPPDPPSPPTLASPSDGSTCQSVNGVRLEWNSVSGASYYKVYFGTNTTPPFVGDTNNLYWDTPGLNPGTRYYWRIKTYKDEQTSGYSSKWSFTTEPGQASNPNPYNAETGVPLDADLSWTPGVGATSHDVYFGTGLSDVNESATPVSNGQDANSYNPGTLDSGTIYYWRIDEEDANGCTRKGDVWQFTTCAVPGQAINPDPNGTTGEPINVVLSWTPDNLAESHDVYFGTDPNNLEFMRNTTADVNYYDTRRICAFLFTDTQITDTGSLGRTYENDPNTITWAEAFGINKSGRIVGVSYDPNGNPHAFINIPDAGADWTSPLTNLHTFGDANESVAYDISDANWIVGKAADKAFYLKYPDDMNMIELPGLFSETDQNSVARAISNGTDGLSPIAVGWSGGHAVFWDNLDSNDPNIYNLGTVASYYRSKAYNVNEYRQMVGYYYLTFEDDPKDRAFVGGIENGLTDIGTLEQGSISRAYGINNSGQVVGEATIDPNGDQLRAFVYDGSQMYNLNKLIDTDPNDPCCVLISALSINDDGYIVGYGKVGDFNDPDNYARALLLVPARPVGHWQFDETSGTVAMDISMRGNHGQVYGATWTRGKIRGALRFDGDGDYVDCGDDSALNLDYGSWGAWVKLDSKNQHRRIIFKENSTGTGIYELFYWKDSDRFEVEVVVSNTRYEAVSSSGVNTGQWYHLFATYDGETLRLYVDGEEVDSEANPSGNIDDNTGPLGVGANPSAPTYEFDGVIDGVRIYPWALSQAEIKELFEGKNQN